MKVGNKVFLFLMIGLICMTVVGAAPVQKGDSASGLDIEILMLNKIKQNQDHKFHVHIFNASNGVPLYSSDGNEECFIHLYTPSNGGHYVEDEMGVDGNGIDFDYTVTGGNFTAIGQHAGVAWCNNSFQGDFIQFDYEVTQGFVGTLGFYIILLILSLGIIIIGYAVEDEWILILGAFGLMLLGLFMLLYGIVGIKDSVYTYSFSIITIMLGAYFAIRASINKIDN